nr:hypothetical protein [Anaerolineae bacterium]
MQSPIKGVVRIVGLIQLALLAWLGILKPLNCMAARDNPTPESSTVVVISSPAEGAIVSGSVMVIGTVFDPAFESYELEFLPDPAPSTTDWEAVQPPVEQMVINGVIGSWDTTGLLDGFYILRVTLNRTDGEPVRVERQVTVSNATPTPTLTAQPTRTPEPPSAEGPDMAPTSLIQQPPTRTPRPTATPGGSTSTPQGLIPPDSPLQPANLRRAAFHGMLIAGGVFVLLGIYSFVRQSIRGSFSDSWKWIWREVIGPLVDAIQRQKQKRKKQNDTGEDV